MSFEHESVLVGEVVEYLTPRPGKINCDGTTGGGGHLAALIAVPETTAIGIDRDISALQAAETRLGDRARLVHGQFSEMPQILAELGVGKVDGILLDLGVSSPQLDQAERGFSFSPVRSTCGWIRPGA